MCLMMAASVSGSSWSIALISVPLGLKWKFYFSGNLFLTGC